MSRMGRGKARQSARRRSRTGAMHGRSRITSDQFRDARVFGGFSREAAAEFLGVSLRTVGHWETGKARPSYAALRLLRVYRHGEFAHPAWHGFRVLGGRLVTPEGRTFTPGEMGWQSLLVQRARFNSLPAVIAAATLRSGGGCSFDIDRAGPTGACLISTRADFLPRDTLGPYAVRGLPPSNRGVSETERQARQGHETRTTTAFEANSCHSSSCLSVGPEWGHNGATTDLGKLAHDSTSQAQSPASGRLVSTRSAEFSLAPCVGEHVHPASVESAPCSGKSGGRARAQAARSRVRRDSTATQANARATGVSRSGPGAGAGAGTARRASADSKSRKESTLSMRKSEAVQALPRQAVGGAA